MCRLFAYVHAGAEKPMRAALDSPILDEFRGLSGVHRDGWGMVSAVPQGISAYVSSLPLCDDSAMFEAFLSRPLESAIIHERWASPGISLSLDNQQPFTSNGLAFAHNGTIGNESGNIVDRPISYRDSIGLPHSRTMSDSKIYAELFFHALEEVQRIRGTEGLSPDADDVCHALARAIALLRRDYPESSFNNVILTRDFTFATRAHADQPVYSDILRRRYEAVGWADRIDTYFEIAYASFKNADGSITSVASSSGYPASDPWTKLANNAVLAISRRDGSVREYSLPYGAQT
jgi:predicted glutamine amidotransferase